MPTIIGGSNGVIKAGACVGVLYIETNPSRIDDRFCRLYRGKWYCVHNGRLAKDYKEGDKQVTINHMSHYDNKKKEIVEERRTLKNVITVGRITGKSPCQKAHKNQPAKSTTTLRPDWCGGIAYRVNSEIRVSNGKYTHYTTSKGERKCLLKSKVLPKNYMVHYLHYNIYNDSTGKPFIVEEFATPRTNVVSVKSTSKQ